MPKNTPIEVIPWKKRIAEGRKETIKWQFVNTKYEIHTPELNDLDLSFLLPHCVNVRNKILSAVQTKAHKATSLFRVFPRTILVVLLTIWENIIDAVPDDATEGDFDLCLHNFIAAHATVEDRHDLLAQLRAACKLFEMRTQTFYHRLREINGYIDWLPGNEPALNDEQLKQAFFDGMPPTWREQFVQAGKSAHAKPLAQVVRYFRQQENLAIKKQVENDVWNRIKNKKSPVDSDGRINGNKNFKNNSRGHVVLFDRLFLPPNLPEPVSKSTLSGRLKTIL